MIGAGLGRTGTLTLKLALEELGFGPCYHMIELFEHGGKPHAELNGKPVEINKISIEVSSSALCKCNGEVIEKTFKVGASGGIGLQSESGKFEFRRIRIKMLE